MVIHEVLHAFQMHLQQIEYHQPGWYPNEYQEWASEGIIEYYSAKQAGLLNELKNHVASGESFHTYSFTTTSFNSSNYYLHAPVFFDFLSKTYGEDKISKLLNSTKPTSAEAFKEVYGMNFAEAGKKFEAWLKK